MAAEFAREWPEFVSQEVVVSQEMGNPGDELIEPLGPSMCTNSFNSRPS